MSALAQQSFYTQQSFVLSELESILEISHVAASHLEWHHALESIAELALQVEGILMIRIEPGQELAFAAGNQLGWGDQPKSGVSGCAIQDINANGWDWGQLRLYFDLRNAALGTPLGFCRFLAQQIAGILNRLASAGEHQRLAQQGVKLAERLARRKVVERAKGILAQMHSISESEALQLLVEISRGTRRSLAHVAQSIVAARS